MYHTFHRFGSVFYDLDSYDQTVDTRIFEYSYVINRLSQLPTSKVLDVGCVSRSNVLAPALASLGFQVYGIDKREFKLLYPGFQFVKGDVTNTDFPTGFFDVVYAVSTFEHMGLSGRYGINRNGDDTDFAAMTEIKRITKSGGHFLITVPYGRARVIKSWARIYDYSRLHQLLKSWTIINQYYFIRENNGSGLLVKGEPDSDVDFEKNEATVLLEAISN